MKRKSTQQQLDDFKEVLRATLADIDRNGRDRQDPCVQHAAAVMERMLLRVTTRDLAAARAYYHHLTAQW